MRQRRYMGMQSRSDVIEYGINADHKRDRYVKCSRCEFMVNMDRQRAKRGSRLGEGLSYVSETTQYDSIFYDKPVSYDCGLAYDSREKVVDNPTTTSGCPNCGTYLYSEALNG